SVKAKLFAQEGAKVVVGDIRDDEGRQVEAEIQELGGDAVYVHLDVTSEAEWQKVVQDTLDRYGKLDILVNNAAIIVPRVEIENTSADSWDRVFEVNAKSVFLGTKHCIPAMRESGGGSIVNISSVAGIAQAYHQEPAYAASKGAVISIMQALAIEYARHGVTANSILPGHIETAMTEKNYRNEKFANAILPRIPANRWGDKSDFEGIAAYLMSDASSYHTGESFLIDGGFFLY
ncbi:MAG: SDR family oxidoreductase, partial [Proteobacteria bacterium]|nr:SDR family oxidoreductase [Pseudomonadota bacterium]